MERRGDPWTARQAEAELGLAAGTIDVWVARGHIRPIPNVGRPRLFWSDDLYDCQADRAVASGRNLLLI